MHFRKLLWKKRHPFLPCSPQRLCHYWSRMHHSPPSCPCRKFQHTYCRLAMCMFLLHDVGHGKTGLYMSIKERQYKVKTFGLIRGKFPHWASFVKVFWFFIMLIVTVVILPMSTTEWILHQPLQLLGIPGRRRPTATPKSICCVGRKRTPTLIKVYE